MFTRATVREISSDIVTALAAVEEKHGVKIDRGNASFTGNNFSLKIKVAAISEDGDVLTKEAQDYDLYADAHDLPKRNTVLNVHGRRLKMVGFKPRSTKFPVLVEDLDAEKTYKYAVDTIKIYSTMCSSNMC